MKINTSRIQFAFKAMTVHFGLSLLVAALMAWLVFTIWYPYPFREMSGGRELFLLVIGVDVICGPLLTFILFAPTKPRKELITDISLIVIIQVLALCYGAWNVWLARPIYLVQEGAKFHVVSRVGVDAKSIDALAPELKPQLFSGPLKVRMRGIAANEQDKINALIQAGKDKSQLPQLYMPYDGVKAYQNAQPLNGLLKLMPNIKTELDGMVKTAGLSDINQLRFAYILSQDSWFGILTTNGEIIGYLRSN
jgi:hypothetical protein